MYSAGIPDLDIKIQHMVAEGDSWHNVDDLGLLQQIGVIPALG